MKYYQIPQSQIFIKMSQISHFSYVYHHPSVHVCEDGTQVLFSGCSILCKFRFLKLLFLINGKETLKIKHIQCHVTPTPREANIKS